MNRHVYNPSARIRRLPLAACLATLLGSAPGPAGADDFSILYLEPLELRTGTTAEGARKTAGDPFLGTVSFDAYGRRFDLILEHNDRVMRGNAATATAYRGAVVQQPGSWVRLTRAGDVLYGLLSDGHDLYVIEPAGVAREFAVGPPAAVVAGNVIYRLSDTLVQLGPDFCDAVEVPADAAESDGLTAFKSITADLKQHTVLQQSAGAGLRLQVSALGDAALRGRFASAAEAENAVLVRLNNVDGIFSAQVGVELAIDSLTVYEEASDPFSETDMAGDLLGELGLLRKNTEALRSTGLTHLFTGRNLDGQTVGIAYIDSLCRTQYAAGLTESTWRGSALESLIAAHEIGHNFGAIHDGSGECAATPSDRYIMAPQADVDNDSFSQCSLEVMSRAIAEAACITTTPPADVTVAFAPAPGNLITGQAFSWSVSAWNAGGRLATDALLEVTVPDAFVLQGASVTGGTCTNGAGAVQCTLGSLAAGESRIATLQLQAQAAGVHAFSATIAAASDANPANNSAGATLAVDAVAPSVSGSAPAASSGGGGSPSPGWLLLAGLLAFARRLQGRSG